MKWTPLVIALFFAGSAAADSMRFSKAEPTSDDGKEAVKILGDSLKAVGLASDALSCERLVVVIPGAGQDISYGGVCTASGHPMMVCDDTMIGKLTIKYFASGDDSELAEFTATNCPPGG